MSDDLNLSGPEKFLRSIGTTLEEVGAWLKGIGLSLIGGSESTATEPKPVAVDQGKKKKESEENEQEQGEAEEQAQAQEKIKAEEKSKAEEEARKQEKAQEEEKLRAQAEQLKNQVEGDLGALQKLVESIVETKLREPVAGGLAKLKLGLEAALKVEALPERSSALGSLVQEIATVKSDAEVAAKESEKLVEVRKRVAQVQSQVESALGDVEKTVLSIAEVSLQEPQTQQLEGLKKRLSTTMSGTDPAVQEQEFGTLLVDIGKQKEEANAAKLKSDEIVIVRERIAQLQKQVETSLVEAGKVVDSIAEASLKDPEALKLGELKKRQTTAINLKDLDTQEKDFNTLVGDIGKFKGEADLAKKASDEVQATRLRVEQSKKQIEQDLTALKKVVDGIAEVPQREPSSEALDKLNKSLETALQLATPGEQEIALTELGKEIVQARSEADKAAKESEEIVAARERVALLKAKVEKELEAAEIVANETGVNSDKDDWKKLSEEFSVIESNSALDFQEREFALLSQKVADHQKRCEKEVEERKKYEQAYLPVEAEVEKARKAITANPRLPSAAVKILEEAFVKVMTNAYGDAIKVIPALKKAAEAINQLVADSLDFFKELAKLASDIQTAKAEVGFGDPAPKNATIEAFHDAEGKMDKAIENADWPGAEFALEALDTAIGDVFLARQAKDSCDNVFQGIVPDWNKARALINGAGVPDIYAKSFWLADQEMDTDYRNRDWEEAEKKIPALKSEVDDVLEVAARGAAYYSEFEKIQTQFDEATRIVAEDLAPSAAIVNEFENAKAGLFAEVENERWDDAIPVIPTVLAAAEAVQLANDQRDNYNLEFGAFAGDYNAAKAVVGRGMVPEKEAGEFNVADEGSVEPFNSRDWPEATKRLEPLRLATVAVQDIIVEGDAYFSAYNGIADDADFVGQVFELKNTFPDALGKQFEDARDVVRTHAKNNAWDLALQAVTPLKNAVVAALKSNEERNDYLNEMSPIRARYKTAFTAVGKAGMADPESKNLYDTDNNLAKAINARDWVTAKAKVAPLKSAIEAVENVLKDPAAEAYHKEFAKIEEAYDKAWPAIALNADKLDLLTKRFNDAQKVAQDAAKKKDFTAATNALPALKKAVDELDAAATKYTKEKEVFDKKLAGLTDLPAAQKIAHAPPKKLAGVQAKAFQDLYIPFNDARRAGEFDEAAKAIAGLQVAINELVSAHATYLSEKGSYESELKKVSDLSAAQEMAAGGSSNPLISSKVGAFNLAKKAVDDAAALEDWTIAQGKLSALKGAAEELLKGAKQADGEVSGEDVGKFKEKIKLLETRTKLADAPDQPVYIEALQVTVRQCLKEVTDSIGKTPTPEYAKAEIGHKKLLVELVAMESAKTKYGEHFKKFETALNGEVEKARTMTLVPPTLAKQRTDALLATEKRIKRLAGSGKLAKADKEVAAWINEAKAWKASKAAYDNLHSTGEPDPVKLKTLGSMPGGDKVLDALMAGLPEDKPQKFMKEAMTARFGFTVKQFEKKDPDRLENLPTTEISKELPDKSLKKMYELMAKLPSGNVKGPIKQLIRFDEDQFGAAFTGGTEKIVWMYCGRANDPEGTKQHFNQPNTIVPEGETVEPDFQAVDDKEVPYFDFATLHEVGHAVESADPSGIAPLLANAAWQKHSSDEVADKAATHFGYDLNFVKTMLADKNSTPPPDVTTVPTSSNATQWAQARDAVVDWCQSVRVSNELWNKPGVSKKLSIGGRVYQEAYEDDWVSYDVSARSKGISSYQFRASGEWFAELYAAYFSKKLKKTHPYAPALKKLKQP